ncbi:MAG: ABC transporter ATP-binding protein [Acidimicrobiaceae bacterium]|nr:ABC transporter ATP-binding protein [Acidimicrobiaceae bacterium]
MSPVILEAMSLCRTFKLPRTSLSSARAERHAVVDIDLTVNIGDRLGIVGESGSGKTTLAKLLLCLDKPSSGVIKFKTQELPLADMAKFRREVQVVFQDPRSSLDPRMTIDQIIREPLECLNLQEDHDTRIDEVLDHVDLERKMRARYPHELSGGQRQRVAIARALAPRPTVLIADEPVSALDVLVRDEILQLLAGLTDNLGLTIILISHDLSVIARLCDKVVVMQHGRIVESGATENVFRSPQHQFTAELVAAVPRLPEIR